MRTIEFETQRLNVHVAEKKDGEFGKYKDGVWLMTTSLENFSILTNVFRHPEAKARCQRELQEIGVCDLFSTLNGNKVRFTVSLEHAPKKPEPDVIDLAKGFIDAAEKDLRRTLSDGERRDLLKDNTPWDDATVAGCVLFLAKAKLEAAS